MNDDRSRADRPATGVRNGEASWLDRLRERLHLKSRDATRGDLEDALSDTAEHAFSPQERAMLKNVLEFHRVRVEDVMVPRADIVAVAAETTLGDLLGLFRTAGHSRLPVYGETLDDPRGMVHIRDFLDYIAARAETGGRHGAGGAKAAGLGEVDLAITLESARILRPVLYVPRSMPAIDLLVRMQTTRTHMALVIDEYGGTDGLVSIEDIVESVVGDIEDEHDEAGGPAVQPGPDDAFIVDARASLEEVSEALGIDLSVGDMAEEVDTIGGLLVTLAGRVPSRGELITGPSNLEIEVLDADPRRVKRLRIHPRAAEAAPGAPAAEIVREAVGLGGGEETSGGERRPGLSAGGGASQA